MLRRLMQEQPKESGAPSVGPTGGPPPREDDEGPSAPQTDPSDQQPPPLRRSTRKKRSISVETPTRLSRKQRMSPMMQGKELPRTPVPGTTKGRPVIQASRLDQNPGQERMHFDFPSTSSTAAPHVIPVVPGSPSGDRPITGNQMEALLQGMEHRLGAKTDRNTACITALEKRMDKSDHLLDDRIRRIVRDSEHPRTWRHVAGHKGEFLYR